MADLYGFVQQQNASRASDGTSRGIRITRDGAILQIPWLQALCLEGRVFGAAPGSTALGTTVGPYGGTVTLDLDEFDFLQTIPATVAIIPIYINVGIAVTGTAGEGGFHAYWGGAGVVGANGVSVTPHNLRPASSNVSACTVVASADDGGTAFVPAGLVARRASNTITVTSGFMDVPAWSVVESGYAPVIEGLASPARQLGIWVYSQGATTGFIQHVWAELPIAAVV